MPTSAGTKVSNSKDSSVLRENPGPVPSDSLAAESTRQGGGFAANPAPHATSTYPTSSSATMHNADNAKLPSSYQPSSENQSSQEKQGAKAPTYVNAQAARAQVQGGPHGKNITEAKDGWSGAKDGTQVAMNAEIGSKDDPSRLATLGMAARNERGGRGAETGDGGAFDALKEADA